MMSLPLSTVVNAAAESTLASADASVCFVAQDVIPSKSAVERMPAAILLSVFITVLLLLIRISVYYAKNSCKVNEQKPEKCLPNVIILSKISKLIYFADLGKLTFAQAIQTILPIHFCSIIIWVIIIAILIDYKPMISFGAVCGLLGTLVYLLYPAEGLGASFIHFRAFSSIFTHSVGFVLCFNLFAFKYVKLEIKDMWKTFVLLASMVVYCAIMNLLFPYDANGNLNNYLFMVKNPTPIDTGVIPYQIVFMLIACIFFASFYLIPYFIKKQKLKKSQKNKA